MATAARTGTRRRKAAALPLGEPAKPGKAIPHAFVLDALASLMPRTRRLFSCIGVYVGDKIVLALRDKPDRTEDNGLWLATSEEHHRSLRQDFPNMRSIMAFGRKVTGWQVLPADSEDFEQAALRACELVIAQDERIGKLPKPRRRPGSPR